MQIHSYLAFTICIAPKKLFSLGSVPSLEFYTEKRENSSFGSPDPLRLSFPFHRDVDSGKKKFFQFFFVGLCFPGGDGFFSTAITDFVFGCNRSMNMSFNCYSAFRYESCIACCYVGAEGSIVGGLIFGDFVDRSVSDGSLC